MLSLWQTLSVGLAKAVTLSGQVSFSLRVDLVTLNLKPSTYFYHHSFCPLPFQEPFYTIPIDLTKDLSDEQKRGLDLCLQGFEHESLLGMLYEFIETYVRHIDVTSNDTNWG